MFLSRRYPDYRFHHLHYQRENVLLLHFTVRGADYYHVTDATYGALCSLPIETDGHSNTAAAVNASLVKNRCKGAIYDRLHDPTQSVTWTRDALHQLFAREWVLSLANLYVASEAGGFVGSLSSNWCTMIAKLARTRGDGGADYHSVDRGSIYSDCF